MKKTQLQRNLWFLLFKLWGQAAWTILICTWHCTGENTAALVQKRTRGNMSPNLGHQKIFSAIQTEMDLFLLWNSTETWGCPWNQERWVLTELNFQLNCHIDWNISCRQGWKHYWKGFNMYPKHILKMSPSKNKYIKTQGFISKYVSKFFIQILLYYLLI